MTLEPTQQELYSHIEPIISNMGLSIVELKAKETKHNYHVGLVIYEPKGVTIDQCSEVYKTLYPRLEIIESNKDIHLEVSSPGTNRVLKTIFEFKVFIGKQITILLDDEINWISGIIVTADENNVTIDSGSQHISYSYDQIKKAKLEEVK